MKSLLSNRTYDSTNGEVWLPINGFEGCYEVSNLGRVKALERYVMNNGGLQHRDERMLKQSANPLGYCMVVLCKDGKTYPRLVHRLVAEMFIPNPENKPVIDHIDTNPSNNRVDNLRWVTTQENCMNPLSRKKNSESKKGHPYYGRPLTAEEREKIRQANLGRKASAEARKNLSEAHKNSEKARRASVENIKKAHQANIGKTGHNKGKKWKLENGKRVYYYPDKPRKEICHV